MRDPVSLIICTYNRPKYLKLCLDSLCKQAQNFPLEIIIVDNYPSKTAYQVFLESQASFAKMVYIDEPNTGLSFARNRGVHEATNNWICYLDDDALASDNFLERLFFLIEQDQFDAFGGRFFPWYESQKPKWLPDWFGSFPKHLDKWGFLPDGKFFPGGICAFKKDILLACGLFPVEVGMRGETVGYGEEDAVQIKIRALGGHIGFDPDWTIMHLVADYKQTVAWHIKRSFAKGKDDQMLKGPLPLFKKVLLIFRALFSILYLGLSRAPLLLFKKGYFWQNFVLDTTRHAARMLGKVAV